MAVVVVAEDDDIREVTMRALCRVGHAVMGATGAQAWQLVKDEPPDIVVSDIDMPVMSGVQLCRAIRADPALGGLPVVFVSGSLLPNDDRPAQAEATAMLRKPILPGKLTACLEKRDSPGVSMASSRSRAREGRRQGPVAPSLARDAS